MLHLGRLRLLQELHERGTIAAVADAFQYSPSGVSQQLAMLERETGTTLLERAGRGVRLTDPALVLVRHARVLLERAALAEAELAAAAGAVAGRARIAAFRSAAWHLALPAVDALAGDAPDLRCELHEAEPEDALPALARGEIDLVIGDEWEHHPWRMPDDVERLALLEDPVRVVLPADDPAARRHAESVPLAELAGAAWATGHPGMTWERVTLRACRQHGGFEPDIRHRANDAELALALVARGRAVTLLPDLVLPGPSPDALAVRSIAGATLTRTIYAAFRATDASRPSTRAVLAAIGDSLAATGPRALKSA